jgi:hypothetical protein
MQTLLDKRKNKNKSKTFLHQIKTILKSILKKKRKRKAIKNVWRSFFLSPLILESARIGVMQKWCPTYESVPP